MNVITCTELSAVCDRVCVPLMNIFSRGDNCRNRKQSINLQLTSLVSLLGIYLSLSLHHGYLEMIYLSIHCHHQNDSCINMGSDESHFIVSLTVRDKATRPVSTQLSKRKESQSGFEPRSRPLLTLPLGQTGSRLLMMK